MKAQNDYFSLSFETLRQLPDAVALEEGLIIIDNTQTPHITHLTTAWQGVPVKLDAILIIFCTQGEMEVRVGLDTYRVQENSICFGYTGNIVEVLSVSQSFHCIMMMMTKDYINLEHSHTLQMLQLFKHIQRKPCFTLTGEYASRYKETFIEAYKTIRWVENPLRATMMQSYVFLLYCCLIPILENDEADYGSRNAMSSHKGLYFRFMEILQDEYREHHDVTYYATRLGVTAKHLSRVINEETGQPALKWIENLLILEAKALLRQREMNVQMVSVLLNFPDQSSFGKFFRRNVGLSPKEYRETK